MLCWKKKRLFSPGSPLPTTQPFSAFQLGSICVWVGWAPELNECRFLAIFSLAFLLQRIWPECMYLPSRQIYSDGNVVFILFFHMWVSLSLADLYPHLFCYCNFPSAFLYSQTSKCRWRWMFLCGGWKHRPTQYVWALMERSSFVFSSAENTFCSGDHVSWHSPLDNSESRIQHMLLTEDPQMQPVHTPFGAVSFLQVNLNTWQLHRVKNYTLNACG